MSKMGSSMVKLLVACFLVTTFSGCGLLDKIKDLFGGKKGVPAPTKSIAMPTQAASVVGKGRPVVYIDNEVVLYESEFKDYLTKIVKMYPQLGGALNVDNLPPAFKKTFLNKIVDQKLILRHSKKEGFAQEDKFKKDLAENVKLLEEHMLLQAFEKNLLNSIEATDAEVRSEYDKNRKKYVKVAGGVVVSGVKFDSEAAAKSFLGKAKGKESQFALIGRQEPGGSFKNFGRVDQDTRFPDIPEAVKKTALKTTKPSLEYLRDGKEYWVCYFGEKKETEHYDFDEIKGQIENHIRSQRLQTALSKKIEALKKASSIKIVDEIFEQKEEKAAPLEDKAAVAA